jgi:antitoxin YefM
MRVVNYSEARNNLKSLLDSVSNNMDYAIINRRDAKDAVVMSLEYFNALQETLYLLKSPKNVKHLEKSIKQYKEYKLQKHNLIDE